MWLKDEDVIDLLGFFLSVCGHKGGGRKREEEEAVALVLSYVMRLGSKERAPRVKDESFMNSDSPARQEKKKMNKEVGKGGARAEVQSRVLVPEGKVGLVPDKWFFALLPGMNVESKDPGTSQGVDLGGRGEGGSGRKKKQESEYRLVDRFNIHFCSWWQHGRREK